jgi:hypothetical protein
MNKSIVYLSLLLLFTAWSCAGNGKEDDSAAQDVNETGLANLEFSKLEHDFGKITSGEKVGTIFTFTNTGEGDLFITSASTSCGCTVPKYSKKPIPPGGTGTLEVVFDSSGRFGVQTKTVTVMSNASRPVIVLTLKADIETK